MKKEKVLVVGQTPPPFGGQAVMINYLLDGCYRHIELHHVRMAFSREMDEIGRFSLRKVLHLFQVIFRIIWMKVKHNPSVLYYPPAGPDRIPLYRDLIILLSIRWLFKKTVFHFHAGGLSEVYLKLNGVMRFLFRSAYNHPDAAIRPSELNPNDGELLRAKRNFVVPLGIPDVFGEYMEFAFPKRNSVPKILLTAVLRKSKGVMVLLEALRILKYRNVSCRVKLAGKWASASFRKKVESFVETQQLSDIVEFPGVITGDKKWRAYAESDIFCFPSYFQSESFGVVLIEAMQFGLPVVSTQWRGIPSVIQHEENGYLVPVKNPKAIADSLQKLIENPGLREQMGKCSRKLFLENYKINNYCRRMEGILASL